jgi:hypothetical protein
MRRSGAQEMLTVLSSWRFSNSSSVVRFDINSQYNPAERKAKSPETGVRPVVTALWIIYGAAIALRMAVFVQTAIAWQEGLMWFAVAVALSLWAYFKESLARKTSESAIRGLREQLIKLQGFSEGTASAMGRSLARMAALPETNPKGEEIVDELKEGLKAFRENAKALAESTSDLKPRR